MTEMQLDSSFTPAEFPNVCAHELFEEQVRRAPDAVAVVHGGKRLSYAELNAAADRIAGFLCAAGIGPEDLVGVCMDRCFEMVAALIGVWKAGGAYVPMDTAYPPDRLGFMVDDARVRVLLTQERYRSVFEPSRTRVVCVDALHELDAAPAAPRLQRAVDPSNLAYVMYTSGSTGKPKGAMIVHRGLVNYLWWAVRAYGVKPGDSVPVHSSISFDLTVTSLFTPLMAGGNVELLPDDIGAQNLISALTRAGNRALVKITPAHLELLSREIPAESAAAATRVFVIGGENLLAETLQLWRDHAPATRLINEYGPTETVVGCCVHEVAPSDPRTGSVPIGKAIANTCLYVLDATMKQVAPGAIGELYIGGAGVARGYHNRPELTAERFLKDPFNPDGRLYKTGDLARLRPDGNLEYLGRVDDQVKLRGYRIELGEIEAALAAHPKVQACAVVVREDEPGDKQLVAYVVRRGAHDPAPSDLRADLERRLPDYMVPAHYVVLETLPLTPNGKVDRKVLPAPSRSRKGAGLGGEPRSRTEKLIAGIWSEILRVDGIGIEDDFFDLGGHSLTGTALIARLRDTFRIPINLPSLFEHPTVAGLAMVVEMLSFAEDDELAGSGPSEREEFDL